MQRTRTVSTMWLRWVTVSRPRLTNPEEAAAPDDTVARLGGDEFTVLLEDIRDPSDAIRVAERIQARWTAPFLIIGQEIVITPSIGIALSTTSYKGGRRPAARCRDCYV